MNRVASSPAPFWAEPIESLFARFATGADGLAEEEAAARLARCGANAIDGKEHLSAPRLLIRQFANPLVLILIFGAGVSMALRQWVDSSIILAIVLGSGLLSFFQEFRASRAVLALRARLALFATVLRDGVAETKPVTDIVPGDIVLLAAGNLVPADARVIEANDFLVTEAALTGESLPVEKSPCAVSADAPVSGRTNAVFMGASVRSGTARVLITATGGGTEFGSIAARLREQEPETDFAQGVRHFGTMLLRVMIVIVLAVLTVNQLLGRPVTESLLFAVALAVGLSPELLPAIISVTLSAGARHLARGGVIVRRLEAIENLGSMDVLCTDKTGTLTEGAVSLAGALGAAGASDCRVRDAAFLNAHFESGIADPLDAALCAAAEHDGWTPGSTIKLGEIPYDFQRRRLSVIVAQASAAARMVTKGACADVLAVCTQVAMLDGTVALDAAWRARIESLVRAQGEAGLRVLAVAERELTPAASWSRDDERDMVLLGFLTFRDPPKPDAGKAIADLAALGITVKLISGDNRHVTAHVAAEVGLDPTAMLTGAEIAAMSAPALAHKAARAQLFVEIDPQQKERIVRALQRAGHAVGFLGDGINDAPALHVADIGISVDQAVDVARESADIVLLRRDLDVLRQGVEDGRRIFANTLKYIAITTSANFGNMVSMALATPLLPFLPLLPKQILLNNFLSDLPSVAISTDRVDPEHVACPQRWDMREIQRFMVVFGLVSSAFDLLTFALLLIVLRVDAVVFQTVWFLVSLLTELVVVLILRTRRPALRSRPSRLLLWGTIATSAAALVLPWTGEPARLFGLVPLSFSLLGTSLAVVLAYAAATEAAKRRFYAHATTQHSYFFRPKRHARVGGRAKVPRRFGSGDGI
ncbi:magnesium-translocating P-type ATPase [Sphingomonas cannabina]|uniref:magnesium-translocating P-type ATPase n=1 Tax=Sphingomonas cannabina TaxID=2899123 RepID=UPI001F1B62B3|nr:magnesium-translocating P-type ATPase [Sphingomonas cannabina]UIJ46330.1 magnesium-translocating P-type ATPase [Sphingomonas cannabina]